MADTVTLEEVVALAAQLAPSDKKLLADKLLGGLREPSNTAEYNWENLRGIAPFLLPDEDAQAWVTRTRREADEHRERSLRIHR